MIRGRQPGELIAAGDVLLLGDKAFPVLDTLLVGMPVLQGSINAVYTSEPVTTLCDPFPPKPERPVCACGAVTEYDVDGVYLCAGCFDEYREAANG